MEGSMDDSEHGTHQVRWSFVGSLNWNMGGSFGSGPKSLEEIGRDTNQKQNLCVYAIQGKEGGPKQFKGKIKNPNDVFELIEKIHDLEMHLRRRDDERFEADLSLRANELQKAQELKQTWRKVSNEKTAEMEVLEEEICHMFKELKTKEEQNKEFTKEYMELTEHFIIEELKKESTPFVTRNTPTMKLLQVAQAHYQKFIKLMRRKKKNDE
ncbi:hypothetical protein Golax_024214 [Gossypium laxum]|uniref:Uncharacterized protein n=1 Tax=Gossypium laxum TaxID=34288 RepID=A0A7J8ZD22_9ROSI|nr:hypothetical protein [Gossypium laxum]